MSQDTPIPPPLPPQPPPLPRLPPQGSVWSDGTGDPARAPADLGSTAPAIPTAPPTMRGTAGPLVEPPKWPSALGMICCVFGGFGAMTQFLGVFAPFWSGWMMSSVPRAPGSAPSFAAMQATAAKFAPLQSFAAGLAMLAAILLLIGGIMLLRREPAARRVLIGWAWAKIVIAATGTVIGVVIQQATFQAMQGPSAGAFGGFIVAFAIIGGVIGLLWLLALPVFILIWMARPSVKSHVASWAKARPGAGAGVGA